MGRVANVMADSVYICDDNPRNEDAETIRKEIMVHCSKGVSFSSRETAIRTALSNVKPGDILLIAGKGHEQFQEIGNHKIPFSDQEKVLELLETL